MTVLSAPDPLDVLPPGGPAITAIMAERDYVRPERTSRYTDDLLADCGRTLFMFDYEFLSRCMGTPRLNNH